jgi:LPS sulfotransferase NodH
MTDRPAIEVLFPEVAAFGAGDYANIGSDRPALMIAMTARTGSSHLCSGLASALPIGMPTELFNARHSLVWEAKKRCVTTFADLLASYIGESKDIIVFKTAWIDFEYFKDRVWDMFPNLRVVYLNRIDVEAQAVSLYRAVISGDWHDSPMIKRPPKMSEEELNKRFNLVAVCRHVAAIEREKRCWEDYFFARQLQPMRINYEHFQFDLGAAVKMIAEYMGYADVESEKAQSSFKVVSDTVNDDWLIKVKNYRNGNFFERFKAETSVKP